MAPSIGEAAQHLLASWTRDDWHAAAKSVTARRVKPALIFGLAFWAMRKVAELAQHYYNKRKPPPSKKQEKKQGWGSIVALLGVLATTLALYGFNVDCVCYSDMLSKRDEAGLRAACQPVARSLWLVACGV